MERPELRSDIRSIIMELAVMSAHMSLATVVTCGG